MRSISDKGFNEMARYPRENSERVQNQKIFNVYFLNPPYFWLKSKCICVHLKLFHKYYTFHWSSYLSHNIFELHDRYIWLIMVFRMKWYNVFDFLKRNDHYPEPRNVEMFSEHSVFVLTKFLILTFFM